MQFLCGNSGSHKNSRGFYAGFSWACNSALLPCCHSLATGCLDSKKLVLTRGSTPETQKAFSQSYEYKLNIGIATVQNELCEVQLSFPGCESMKKARLDGAGSNLL